MLDDTDWKILEVLQENARLPFAELGRRVGLTSPAVAERVRKLEESGIVRGYHVELDNAAVGLPIQVVIQFGLVQSQAREMTRLIREMPEVLECYNVTGLDCFIMKAVVPDMQGLQTLIEYLSALGRTTTSIILSEPVPRRAVDMDAIRRHLAGLNPR